MFKIMDYRNDELLRANGTSLKDLADKTAHENGAMLAIARKAKADSQTMKIATLLATIYLPIIVVTVCLFPVVYSMVCCAHEILALQLFCSTGFVQFNSRDGRATDVTVRKEIWAFIVIAMATMSCSWAAAYLWARRRKPLAADQTSETEPTAREDLV